jgi:alkylation response protein AidB-like acyl-CoA dehydrogenase
MTEIPTAVAPLLADLDAAMTVAAELAEKFRATSPDRDRERAFPHGEVAELKRAGLGAVGVSREEGGPGLTYGERCRVLRRIAESDSSIAQILLVQLFWAEVVTKAAPSQLRAELTRGIAAGEIWLGNAASEIGTKTSVQSSLTISRDGDEWLINGRKFYCTGSLAADEFVVTGVDPATEEHRLAFVPADTAGMTIIDDWSGMGQRGTASGSIEFVNLRVPAGRVPDPEGFMDVFVSRSSMISVFAQNLLASIHTGIGKDALRDTVDYVTGRARPWFQSGVERAADDPYIRRHVGRSRALIDATEAIQDRSYASMDAAAAAPTEDSRGRAIVEASKAKLLSTEAGLEICERLFQVSGSSATVAKYDLDRHWRNLRTLSLHDPVDYKASIIGDYELNGRFPEVSYYT